MKKCLFLLFFFLNTSAFAFNFPAWLTYPSDHVTDEVKLFPFGEEFKYNYFLDRVVKEEGLFIHLQLVQSLQGGDIDEKSQLLMDNLLQRSDRVLLFYLSLSDRRFKISSNFLSDEQVNQLIQVTVPSLRNQQFANGIRILIQNALFQINDQNLLTPPPLGKQKRSNINILIFFASAIFFIFLLGHKLRKSVAIKEMSPGLEKKKSDHVGVFW